ncbi:hypothetical protein OROMI_028058 [Orobanche minor]
MQNGFRSYFESPEILNLCSPYILRGLNLGEPRTFTTWPHNTSQLMVNREAGGLICNINVSSGHGHGNPDLVRYFFTSTLADEERFSKATDSKDCDQAVEALSSQGKQNVHTIWSRRFPRVMFIVVPFIEFLLPTLLKFFPNISPSAFQAKMMNQEQARRKLVAKIEYAKFLQATSRVMAKEAQNMQNGDIQPTGEDFIEFRLLTLLRDKCSSREEIFGYAKF